mmetsp:Transcript_44166/g.105708  ORF Transcript_44166/g.105708 Transcript_44166/m.105708 type:complete len:740 (-) Transcript_44166:82-2301(-)
MQHATGLPAVNTREPWRATTTENLIGGPWWRPKRLATSASLKDSRGFLERNGEDESAQRRRGLALLQRDFVHEKRAHDNLEFEGAQGAEGFRKFLRRKFGSALAGWRVLDWDCSGRLSLNEFCTACRRLGFHGNLKQLWRELDVNDNGYVSMMELDPEAGQYIATFKLELMHEYGDMLTAWQKGIDTNGNRRIDAEEIEECCKKLGLSLDPKKLFDMLRGGPKDRGVTLQQFDPDAWKRWITSDFGGLLSKVNTEFFDDFPPLGDEIPLPLEVMLHPVKDGLRKWRQTLHSRDRAWIDRAVGQNSKYRSGVCTLDGFRQLLKSRHGSLLGAWREALDLDGNGRITFCEFCQAMQRLGFQAETLGLWKKLDAKNEGKVYFKDLDPETDAALAELQKRCEEVHGNMLLAWLKEMDRKGTGIVNESQFSKAFVKLGCSGKPKKLFRLMQPDITRKFITLRDFDTKAFLALSRGDFRMLSEQPDTARKTALQKTFMERQEGGWFFQIRKAWEASRREEYAKACKMDKDYEFVIDTIEEFEDLCIRRFGSMLGAWRQVIDWDANGKITFNEFCNALRRLGYAGDFRGLWRKYDTNQNGHISLKEMDPETDELISSLLNLLTERYGSIDAAWLIGFGKDPHDSCDLRELREVCEALGYSGDVAKLFDKLQPMPGRALITIWDLDPACNRKRQRGDVRFISSGKSPNWGSRRSPSPRSVSEEETLASKGPEEEEEDPAAGGAETAA